MDKTTELIKKIVIIAICICAGTTIQIFYNAITNQNNQAVLNMTSILITVGLFIYKNENEKQNIIQNFLYTKGYLLKDNIRNGNPLGFGIIHETNWKNKWNSTQEKNTISFIRIVKLTIIKSIQFILLVILFDIIGIIIEITLLIIIKLIM